MTQEDKELLMKDLCARLLYEVIVNYKDNEYDWHCWKISTLHALSYSKDGTLINTDSDGWIDYIEYRGCGMSSGSRPLHLGEVKPYLRPMSSMTEAERSELSEEVAKAELGISDEIANGFITDITMSSWTVVSYCLKKHLDINGLIEKGLAVEAPEGMYKK